ncbi:hypothetical protein TTRE_0000381301 [Trichuris trichiura]|uniref:Uncharacterized protein n=1 Tax=Trichuris trichiura TaxID=36087 RepID=A0A077Z5V8_TRITR|nr:hypothetical protein TTRE_0000381301 [Trichuris trichiura]
MQSCRDDHSGAKESMLRGRMQPVTIFICSLLFLSTKCLAGHPQRYRLGNVVNVDPLPDDYDVKVIYSPDALATLRHGVMFTDIKVEEIANFDKVVKRYMRRKPCYGLTQGAAILRRQFDRSYVQTARMQEYYKMLEILHKEHFNLPDRLCAAYLRQMLASLQSKVRFFDLPD